MTQRTIAALIAVPLVVGLLWAAGTRPLPYVSYQPGLTVDVLAEEEGTEMIEVSGRKTYRDDGELRLTTVLVSSPQKKSTLVELMSDWLSPDDAVYPYEAVYRPDETAEESEREGAVDMVSSQDAATAVALRELGVEFRSAVEVLLVEDGAPADGRLRVRDVFLEADGAKVRSADDLVAAITEAGASQPVRFLVLRDGRRTTVEVVPEEVDGRPQVGIRLGDGFVFPFQVSVNIDDAIGGPSAGLMFSLGIYDTLTEGSLTGGRVVAGTGTVDPDGTVGPIGGIQQKIAGARDAGAELFLVPPDNCAEALAVDTDELRLVRATTMHDAVAAIEAWVKDPTADLPSCEEAS